MDLPHVPAAVQESPAPLWQQLQSIHVSRALQARTAVQEQLLVSIVLLAATVVWWVQLRLVYVLTLWQESTVLPWEPWTLAAVRSV